jgi:hypothetical protein
MQKFRDSSLSRNFFAEKGPPKIGGQKKRKENQEESSF